MSKKIRISEYKGFELWDTPMPEGWSVHSYPVQVTCNGKHVNSFADANEAMSVIDGMDAYTIAYHMRKLPAQPAPAGDGGLPADWIPSDDIDSLDYAVAMLSSEFVKSDRYSAVSHHFKAIDEWHADALATEAALREQLAAAQAANSRLANALAPFSELYGDWLVNRKEIEFFDYLNRYRVSDELLAIVMNASVVIQETAQALQATEQ